MSDCRKRVENTTSESLWDVNGKRHLLSILPPKHRTQTIWQNFVILTSPKRLGESSKKGLFMVRLTAGVDPPTLRSAFKHFIYSFSSAKPGMILNVFFFKKHYLKKRIIVAEQNVRLLCSSQDAVSSKQSGSSLFVFITFEIKDRD